ncbi:MAG TPA: FAD-binding oxidoreductase, partial [Candidatus Dormibacteraeota bacterium]|nr:FAD-binding oxidoreductase [Candidatus Dormibacteraeota bacterium]
MTVVPEQVIDQQSASALATELRRSFSGDILTAGDPEYDEARTIWNAMVDKKPAVIARCATTEDVAASVKLARRQGLEASIRCGG